MTDSANSGETPGAASEGQQPQLNFKIMTQYIRDLSFENIVAQKGVQGEVTPEIQVQVALDAKKRPIANQYEVISKYNVTSKNKGDGTPLFVLEMEYAGLFHIENVPEEQMHPFLLIECPRMLFPFARRIIADMTRDGGFPQLALDNIDFVQLYRQQLMQKQAEMKAKAAEAGTDTVN